MPYSIRHGVHEVGYLVSVTGDADLSAAREFRQAIDTAVTPTVVVDLSEATLIDSRTISVLVDRTDHLRARGGDLIVVCPDPNILRLFRRIGLETELTIVASRTAALQAVREGEREG